MVMPCDALGEMRPASFTARCLSLRFSDRDVSTLSQPGKPSSISARAWSSWNGDVAAMLRRCGAATMSEFWLVDQIRSRVFVVTLPGMTRRRERDLVKRFRKMTQTALASGVPLVEAWSEISGFVERMASRLRTEQERETFVAIMQRLRQELMAEYGCVSR